jgi:hypothetical protein
MSTEERTVYRYGDFPELFWDVKPDAEIDRTNLRMIARVLEHAPPETLWKLVPVDVLLRSFEKLDLPEHTRRFWSVVVRMMREQRGIEAPHVTPDERGLTYRTRPRFHPQSDLPRKIPERTTYRYGDLPELFWDLEPDEAVDGTDPAIIVRLLEDAPPHVLWKIVSPDVLLREFDALNLQEHTRRFWSVVVDTLRQKRGVQTGSDATA